MKKKSWESKEFVKSVLLELVKLTNETVIRDLVQQKPLPHVLSHLGFFVVLFSIEIHSLCCCCRLDSYFFVFSWSLFCFLVFIYRSWAVFYGLCRLYCFCRYIFFSLSFSRFSTILQIKSILFVICVSRLWFHGWFHLAQEMLFSMFHFNHFLLCFQSKIYVLHNIDDAILIQFAWFPLKNSTFLLNFSVKFMFYLLLKTKKKIKRNKTNKNIVFLICIWIYGKFNG